MAECFLLHHIRSIPCQVVPWWLTLRIRKRFKCHELTSYIIKFFATLYLMVFISHWCCQFHYFTGVYKTQLWKLFTSYFCYLLFYFSKSRLHYLPHDRPINRQTTGAKNTDFIWKASAPRRWPTISKTILPKLEFRLLLKREGMWFVVASFLVL